MASSADFIPSESWSESENSSVRLLHNNYFLFLSIFTEASPELDNYDDLNFVMVLCNME